MPINVLHMVPDLMELNYTLVVNTKKDVIKITVQMYITNHIYLRVLLGIILLGLRLSWGNKWGESYQR